MGIASNPMKMEAKCDTLINVLYSGIPERPLTYTQHREHGPVHCSSFGLQPSSVTLAAHRKLPPVRPRLELSA